MTSTDRIEKHIVLRAPRSRVWRALTDAGEFGQWFRVKLEGAFAEGATVRCWDPMARLPRQEPWTLTTRHETPLEAVTGADAAMIVTEWPELRQVAWEQARAAMTGPVLLDGRNVLNPQAMASAGFTYLSVGRSTTRP